MIVKICCVFNYNPLYRYPIYHRMDEDFNCDFYFGDTVFEQLKSFDAKKLKGFRGTIKARKTGLKSFVWHSGILPIFNRKYTHYILTGDAAAIVNWMIIFYAMIFNKKVYLWTHGIKENIEKSTTKCFLKIFYTHVAGILMYNHYNCKYMKTLGVKEECLHVIHNSLDSEKQTSLYNKLVSSNNRDIYIKHFNNNNPVIIYIGRIQKRMKVEMLIDALCILKERGLSVNAVIVGQYVDGVDIEKIVQERGLEQSVWMYGPSFDEEMNSELLYNADVCVAPGTIGLTAIHSLSYGTPCITHSNHSKTGPEFEAIKDGITGSFFEENNVYSLADAISYWVNMPSDKRLNVRLSARKEIEENWCVDSQIGLLSKILQ